MVKNYIQYRSGGKYLPHIGAWVTSMARAKLHEDMYKYEAIDCATDSFKTLQEVPTSELLGRLKQVCQGLLLIIRPKLYVMFSEEIQDEVQKIGDLRDYLKITDIKSLRPEQDIIKFALHGFWGNIYDLLHLY